MELLITAIGIGSSFALLQSLPQWQSFLTKTGLDRKPFNCALCSAFWGALAYFGLGLDINITAVIFNTAIASITSELLWRKLMTY